MLISPYENSYHKGPNMPGISYDTQAHLRNNSHLAFGCLLGQSYRHAVPVQLTLKAHYRHSRSGDISPRTCVGLVVFQHSSAKPGRIDKAAEVKINALERFKDCVKLIRRALFRARASRPVLPQNECYVGSRCMRAVLNGSQELML